LVAVADAALDAAIAAMAPGNRVGDVSVAVETTVLGAGLEVLREYCGHGIGRAMHEWPDVPNWGRAGRGPKLGPGAVLAVEPMVVVGSPDVEVLDDGWSVRTTDGRRAAHTEHTIAVTDDGAEVLTRL
jgi:methionyl aminopeptidase